jgi:hypothetical protein
VRIENAKRLTKARSKIHERLEDKEIKTLRMQERDRERTKKTIEI